MIPRSDILALLTEIAKRKSEVEKLPSKDAMFLIDINTKASHYGYTFTEPQLKWLSAIYRKVYENVEG